MSEKTSSREQFRRRLTLKEMQEDIETFLKSPQSKEGIHPDLIEDFDVSKTEIKKL